MANEILVLGATGKTGRRVAERLQKRGIAIRGGSRDGNPPFDWDKPENWETVLDGVQKVYVTYYPDFVAPGAMEKIRRFVDIAKKSGAETAMGYAEILRDYQVPEDIIWLMQHLFTEELDGRNESVTHDIENVIGRKPTTFSEYVAKANQTGVWNIQN